MKINTFKHLIYRDVHLPGEISMFAESFENDLVLDREEVSIKEYLHLSKEYRASSDPINKCSSLNDLDYVLELENNQNSILSLRELA